MGRQLSPRIAAPACPRAPQEDLNFFIGDEAEDQRKYRESIHKKEYEDEVNAYTAERVRVTGGASGRAKTRGLHLKRIEGNARVLGDVVPGWCTSVCECSSVRV